MTKLLPPLLNNELVSQFNKIDSVVKTVRSPVKEEFDLEAER